MGNDWFHEYFINELKAIGRKPTSNMQHEVVDSLPSSGNEQTIYFVKNDSSSSNNHYDEYVWIPSSSTFEKIGSTQIDGSTTQPDWNQNDATQPDYVKNRPFYTGDPVETVFVEETSIAFEYNKQDGLYIGGFASTFSPIVGETYKVSWDGTAYECTCRIFEDATVIGNLSIVGVGSDTGEPFLMGVENDSGIIIYAAGTASSHTFSISSIVTPVVKINPKYLDQSDWDQNDETAPSYVKNRPFYTGYTEEKTLIEECTVTFRENNGNYSGSLRSKFTPIVGETYKVSWDGTVYESVCLNVQRKIAIGNLSIMDLGSNTGEPFLIRVGNYISIYTLDAASSHVISVSGRTTQVVKIDEKYLPDTVATKSDVEDARTTANNAHTVARNNREVLDGTFNSVATFTFDKQTSGRDTFVYNAFNYYKISDFNPSPEDVISFKGIRENGNESSIITTGNNCAEYGLFIIIASAGVCSIPITETTTMSFTAPSVGLYARYEKGDTYSTAGTGEFTLRWPIEILLRSSQSYKTKQFKIAVDDSGIIKIVNTSDGNEVQLARTSDIQNAVTEKISNLNKADTAVDGQYVSAVTESNGIITVTRANLPDIPNDDHINELINTALSVIGVAEEGAY